MNLIFHCVNAMEVVDGWISGIHIDSQSDGLGSIVLLMGHSRPLFLYFCHFNTVDCECSIRFFADDWIRTADLWSRKRRSTN